MRFLHRLLLRLVAVALGLLLALVLLELGLRAAGALPIQRNSLRAFHDSDARLGWSGAPDYRARFVRGEFDVVVESGPDGFRLPEPGPPLEARDAPELLFLGDSFTWGFGVPQGAVYTDVLQRALGPRARVRNCGVNGYSSAQSLLLLRERLSVDAPDVVVLAFYFNDLFENGDPWAGRRPWMRLDAGELEVLNQPVARTLAGPAYRWLRRSRALSLLGYVANRARQRPRAEPDFPLDAANLAERWSLESAVLGELRDACTALGAELVVMYVTPFFDAVPRDPRSEFAALADARFGDELAARCAALELPFLDTRAAFPEDARLGSRGEPYWYASDDHWSPAGHAEVGKWLARELGTLLPELHE